MIQAARGVRTWGETVKKAEALDRIIALIDDHLLPRRGMNERANERELVLDIIAVIEAKAVHDFPRTMPVINPDDTKGRA